jgi:hypothetical protein
MRQSTRIEGLLGAALASFLLAEAAMAQSGRQWVDPPRPPETQAPESPTAPAPGPPAAPVQPRRVDVPPPEPIPPAGPSQRPEASPAPSPAAPTRPAEPPRARTAPDPDPAVGDGRPRDRAAAAQELAIAYLAYWSAPNAITLDATPDFYAPQVVFHGRQMSARALFEEKRRFVRRWPLRDYRPRPETMRAACDPAPPICTVRTIFDFIAESPQTGKRSQGSAILQLGISFVGGEPVIVFESSQVTSRSRGRSEAFEDDDD